MIHRDIREMLSEVFDSMHDGLFMVAADGNIVMVNDALLAMTGYSREEIEEKPCTIFRCDECVKYLNGSGDHWCRLFASGGKIVQKCHIVGRDGRYLAVLKSSKVVRGQDGKIVAAVENVTDLRDLVKAEQRIEQLEHLHGASFCGMVGQTPTMERLFAMTEKAAASDATVIIHGESGVGKQLVADAIHRLGPRRDKPFVQVNCAAFNENLLESEIFGHVRGAFTGAHRHRIGRFEDVQDGDLFLDEVGDIPLPIQVKLLRVLESRQFERVGDSKPLPMGARLISATHQDLDKLCKEGRFRRDFFFRINVVPLRVPPLRERREDIPYLVEHFVKRLRDRTGRDVPGLTPEALSLLVAYCWPGNVRELRSVLEYAFVVCSSGPISTEHLPPLNGNGASAALSTAGAESAAPLSPVETAQREELVAALRAANGNKSAAARELGVTRMTVINRVRKYNIDLNDIRRS